jgi:hypothetical protein
MSMTPVPWTMRSASSAYVPDSDTVNRPFPLVNVIPLPTFVTDVASTNASNEADEGLERFVRVKLR